VFPRAIQRLAEQLVTQEAAWPASIVQNGKVVSMQGYGRTGAPGGQPVTTDTVFRLASLSKAFAATLSAQLVAEDAMNWDYPIINQLPAFKLRDYTSAKTVTVRDVLSHRVGLTHNTYDRDLEGNTPYPLLAERLSDAPLACTPGDCYAYQNIAQLIGDLVRGDRRFLLAPGRRSIFHPLMYNSTFRRGPE
jgi:beta-lactamase class C